MANPDLHAQEVMANSSAMIVAAGIAALIINELSIKVIHVKFSLVIVLVSILFGIG